MTNNKKISLLILLLSIANPLMHANEVNTTKVAQLSQIAIATSGVYLGNIYNYFYGVKATEELLYSHSDDVNPLSAFGIILKHFLNITDEEISKIRFVTTTQQITLALFGLTFILPNNSYNAFTTKNYIFIPEQLMLSAYKNYNQVHELAAEQIALIAHELEHLRKSHYAQIVSKKAIAATIALVSSIGTSSAILMPYKNSLTNKESQFKTDVKIAGQLFALQLAILTPFLKYCSYESQKDECCADALSSVKPEYKRLFNKTFQIFLQRNVAPENKNSLLSRVGTVLKKFVVKHFGTHPLPEDRIARLEDTIQKLD